MKFHLQQKEQKQQPETPRQKDKTSTTPQKSEAVLKKIGTAKKTKKKTTTSSTLEEPDHYDADGSFGTFGHLLGVPWTLKSTLTKRSFLEASKGWYTSF